jgi:DNA polymerase-3 subunit epsilon
LLAEVYIEMIGGRQTALGLGVAQNNAALEQDATDEIIIEPIARPRPLTPRISEQEEQAHDALIAKLGQKGIWAKYDRPN